MTGLLARVEVQVHPDGFLRRAVGQLEGNWGLPSRRVDEHDEFRVPGPFAPHEAQGGSPEGHRAAHVLNVDDNGPEVQVSY